MGEKYEIAHTQTFFSRKFDTHSNRQVSLRLVVYLLIRRSRQWFVDNNKLISLQLRVQRKILISESDFKSSNFNHSLPF
jgi:hypothetical protein